MIKPVIAILFLITTAAPAQSASFDESWKAQVEALKKALEATKQKAAN